MLSSPQNVGAKPATQPPAQPPTPGGNGGASFAQFLTGQASAPPPAELAPPPAPQPPRQPGASTPAAPAAEKKPADTKATSAPAARAPKAGNPPARQAADDADAKADPRVKPQVAADARDAALIGSADQPASDDDAKDDTPDAAGLDELTQLLGLHAGAEARHVAPANTADDTKGDTHIGTKSKPKTGTQAADVEAPSAGLQGRAAPAAAATRSASAAAAKVDIQRDDGEQSARPAALNLPAAAGSQPAGEQRHADAAPGFTALLASQAHPLQTAAVSDAGTAAAQIRAPLHGAAFAPEVGARVSLLAAGGVQQAELQLNPADMGPVSVQIVVDGSQAQVSFHAAQAETRQALQHSLPELAAALQGQGLTLSGGGVFQQAPRDADGRPADDDAAPGTPAGGRAEATAAAAPVRRSVGLLDTFA